MIAARSTDGFIGRNGKLPWKLPTEMRLFTSRTVGQGVVVGRKTYESMLGERSAGENPLSGRVLIVISSSLPESNDHARKLIVTSKLTNVLNMAVSQFSLGEFYVAGGYAIYQAAIPLATRLIISEVDVTLGGLSGELTRFPDFPREQYTEIYAKRYATDALPFTWRVLDKKPEFVD